MSELNMLRCQLRAVNIEYSVIVRRKTGEGAYARMAELRVERGVLMTLIARQGVILESFANLGRNLGTTTIAEEMETAEQLSIHTLDAGFLAGHVAAAPGRSRTVADAKDVASKSK